MQTWPLPTRKRWIRALTYASGLSIAACFLVILLRMEDTLARVLFVLVLASILLVLSCAALSLLPEHRPQPVGNVPEESVRLCVKEAEATPSERRREEAHSPNPDSAL